jgi:hypothetical protein
MIRIGFQNLPAQLLGIFKAAIMQRCKGDSK